ncbi:FABP domain-containing protein [Aphelenchoides bicaudatus]|nr:FABP domain-containing protein [Aphelenchoides bicaudatus]
MVVLNSAQQQLLGSWKLEHSENFDEYMKEIGIGAIKRALGNSTTPVVTISVNEDVWTVQVQSTFKNDEWKFKLNEKFKQKTIDGREFWCVVTLSDDGRIVETQENIEGNNDVPSVITRFVEGGKLVAESQANNVKATRLYVRI